MNKVDDLNVQVSQFDGAFIGLMARFGLMLAVAAMVLVSAAILMLQFAYV
jgi:hypothetical protein